MAAIDVTDETFQTEVIDRSTDVAVVVDLWAEWCGPCKTLGPIIEKVVDGFVGAYPEQEVQRFVESLLPTEEESKLDALIAAGDETSLRMALELEPGNEDAIVALGDILVARGDGEEALALLERIPESERTRKVAAAARIGTAPTDDYDQQLAGLLDRVKDDDDARQQFVDLLELMGPEDPRTAGYRRQLTARLF